MGRIYPKTVMKIAAVLAASVFAQAPSPAKTCTDCKAFDEAFKDEVKQNPNLIDQYVQMLDGVCSSAGSLEKLCEQMAGPALKGGEQFSILYIGDFW